MLYSHQIIKEYINSTEENIEKALSNFSYLSENQLNWKPSFEIWSVGECINHIIRTNQLYLAKIEKFVKPLPTGSEKDYLYSQSFMGKMITKAVDPANVKKFKTFKVFIPHKSAVRKTIVEDYVNLSKQFIEQINKILCIDLKKIRLSSPANILVRINLGDVLIIVPKHDERHLNQAYRLMKTKNFPKEEI
ncbi:MAG: DinB family protein [Ignavibacteriaceae bacterium]